MLKTTTGTNINTPICSALNINIGMSILLIIDSISIVTDLNRGVGIIIRTSVGMNIGTNTNMLSCRVFVNTPIDTSAFVCSFDAPTRTCTSISLYIGTDSGSHVCIDANIRMDTGISIRIDNPFVRLSMLLLLLLVLLSS